MRSPKPTLTEQELEIMKVVWQLETATVRQVYETMLEHRRIAYTTVMTMMNILEQKGYLKKRQDDRAYVYRPSQPKQQVIRSMVREFVNRVFNGSAEPLLVHLVEDQHLDAKDLEEIRKTIRKSVRKDEAKS
jgi:predicted transcriptional regulator